jgi:hypothetical protein
MQDEHGWPIAALVRRCEHVTREVASAAGAEDQVFFDGDTAG